MTLGALLRDARERLARRNGARVRQADVAEYADITVEWYARIERGAVLPSFDVLSRIAAALSLSSQRRIEALRFVLPEQLQRDDLDHPLARAGVDVPEQFGKFVVAQEYSRAITTTSEWSSRAGAVTRSGLFEGTMHGAAHRVGKDLLQTLRLQGFDYNRYRGDGKQWELVAIAESCDL